MCNGRRACDVRMDELSTRFTVRSVNFGELFTYEYVSQYVFCILYGEKKSIKSIFPRYHVKKNHPILEVDTFKVMLP